MAVSKAQQKAVNKYMAANYDRVNVTMPKGKKDVIKAHAETRGESVNAFIGRAIDETMERDNGAVTGSTVQAGVDIPLTSKALAEAQKAAEAAGETVEAFVERAVMTQSKRDKLTLGLTRDN